MAENENFSANIEVNVDLNTTAAEAKLKRLAGKTAEAQQALDKLNAEKKAEAGKAARPADVETMFKKKAKELESVIPNINEFKKAFIDGKQSLIPAFNELAASIKEAGYKLSLNAKTGQVEINEARSRSKQKESAVKAVAFSGNNDIISSSDMMRNLDVAKLQNEIRKELEGLGFTGIGKYIVGSLESSVEQILSKAKAPKVAGEYDDIVNQIEMAEGGALDRMLEDFGKEAVNELNASAKQIAKYAKIKTSENKAFVPTAMSELLAQDKIGPQHIDQKMIQDAADFIPGANGQPVISPEIFMLAAKRALGKLDYKTIAPAQVAAQLQDASQEQLRKEINFTLGAYFTDGLDGIEAGINKIFKSYSYTGEGKNRNKAKVSPEQRNEWLIGQFNILSPQNKIASFADIEEQYWQWVVNEKIAPQLEKQADNSVKGMAFGKGKRGDMLNIGDIGTENFAEFQQRAVTKALPDQAARFGLGLGDVARALSDAQNQFIAPMIRIAAVSGEAASAMKPVTNEFFETKQHLNNFNSFLTNLIEQKLPDSGMTKAELVNKAKAASSQGPINMASEMIKPQSGGTAAPKGSSKKINEDAMQRIVTALGELEAGNTVSGSFGAKINKALVKYNVSTRLQEESSAALAELENSLAKVKGTKAGKKDLGFAAVASYINNLESEIASTKSAIKAYSANASTAKKTLSTSLNDNLANLRKMTPSTTSPSYVEQQTAIAKQQASNINNENFEQIKKGATTSANSVIDAQIAALREASKGDKMQQLKSIMGKEMFDKLFIFIADTIKGGGKFGDLIAGWDTEFSSSLSGVANTILESSIVLRNAEGKMVDLQTFMHRPAYNDPKSGLGGVAGINQKMYLKDPSAGIGSVAAFMKRAGELGIPESELGNIKDAAANTAEASKKFRALQALFIALDHLNIPLSGQNVIAADFTQFKKTMDWLSTVTDQIHLTTGLGNVTDNLTILKKMQGMGGKNDPGMAIAGSKGSDLSQSAVIQSLFKKFPSEMQKYSNFIQPTQNGFKVTIDNKEFKAHTAQADAVASIIVNQVMKTISPAFAALMQAGPSAYLAQNSEFRGPQFPYSKKAMGKSNIQIDPQQRAAEAVALVAATREEDNALRQQQKTMASFGTVVPLFKTISAIFTGTAGSIDEANNALKPLLRSTMDLAEVRRSELSGKKLNKDQAAELVRLNQLQEAFNALHDVTKAKGNKVVENSKELYAVRKAISFEYDAEIKKQKELNQMQNPKLDNTAGKYYDVLGNLKPNQAAEAGKVFGKEIQAQMNGYIAKEKQVESANKNLINTWVTARYALYDVANAYQNVSRNLIMATRHMFNMTQSYRSFETAFTPVERAMSLFPDEVAGLRDEFVKLSEEIPVAFQDLASVATLGAQMGIGAGGIKEFTKTVTEFASVTGVSADTVAQKFGRIAQLTKLDSSDFEKLGSAISYAGVNAVATESEIMSLSEAIAAVSNKAGMSSAEVVGLSTALASLGVAPEQARGVFTRVFADIDRAVAKGGTQLDNFSKTAGMSAADFKAQWGTDKSYEVFRRVLEGINKSGKNMTNTLDSLNLTETREVNTLSRLATNLDVVDTSMQNATSSFAAGTFLGDSFAKTADNLDSKIKIFKNRIDSLTASLSKGFVGSLSGLLDIGSAVADMLKILADNSIIQFLTSATAGALALGGIGAGLTSVMAKVIAQIYAFRVASINSANDPTAVTGWGRQLKALTNYKNEIIEMRDQIQKSETSSNIRGQITPVNYKMSTRKADYNKYLLEEANIYRATGVNAVKAATQQEAANILKKKSAFDALILARQEADSINHIVAVRQAEIVSLETKIAAQVAEGRITNAQAVAIMSEARARQIHYQWINGEVVALSLETELQAIGVGVSDRVTKKKQAEALARMENAAAINAETRAGAVGKGGILEGPGATMMKLAGGALTAITAFTTIYSIVELIRGSLEEASKFNLMESGGGLASLREAISKDTAEYEKTGKAIRTVTNSVKSQGKEVDVTKVKIAGMVGSTDLLNSSIATGTDNVKAQTLAIGDNTKAWIANSLIQNEKLQSLMTQYPDMLDELKGMGIDFKQLIEDSMSGKGIGSGIEDKFKSITAERDALFNKMKDSTAGEGTTDAEKLRYVQLNKQLNILNAMRGVSGELSTALKGATTQSQVSSIIAQILGVDDPNALIDKGKKTITVVLKTLSDYAGDVGGVFDKMLKYKFERRNAFADLQGVVDGVEKGIKDANKALRDLNNSLTENSKKKKRLEMSYQLAVQFGDTERAKEIANEIASVDAEISTNQEDIAYNQEKLAGSLDLTTQAGRDNNETLQGMITSNSQYIQALIDSGASQATINKAIADGEASFRQQAAAMGISTEATNEYAKAFNGFKSIIKGIPKRVNVEANTDPAKRALEEFTKLANGTTVEVKVKTKSEATAVTKADRKIALIAERDRMSRALTLKYVKDDAYLSDYYKNGIKAINKQIESGNYATGGYVSGPGTATSDSIPARLSNGEFVIRASAVSQYGLEFMNALNQQRVGSAPAMPSGSMRAGGGGGVVYLSSRDRELLQAVIDRPITLRTSNRVIAESANDGNRELARRGKN